LCRHVNFSSPPMTIDFANDAGPVSMKLHRRGYN